MNESQFSRSVRACTDRLWRIAYSILQNGADCDDAVQEALLRAWRQRNSLREDAYFETWLIRILINESRRILKKRGARSEALPETLPEPEHVENEALRDAVRELPLSLRIPLSLHYMEGYPIRDVAQLMRLPETTIKWRLKSARKKLKDDLAREDAE